jgi:nicotinamide mononucleotide transporter
MLDAFTLLETTAVILAIAYVYLAVKENILCWPCAFISTMIYTYLFWDAALLSDSLLNAYYMLMAIYGFFLWQKKSQSNSEPTTLNINIWPKTTHALLISITLLISLSIGWFMDNYTTADFPYLDAATTCFSLLATFLQVRKELFNWCYWIIINSTAMYIYISKDFYQTSGLMLIYLILAIWGLVTWRARYNNNLNSKNSNIKCQT